MSSIRSRVTALLSFVLVAALMSGCSGGDSKSSKGSGGAKDLPQGQAMLQESSAAMKDLKSVGVTIATEGKPNISIKGGDIKLLKSGDATGTLQIQQAGQTVEMNFVLLRNTVYFKGATGGYQKLPKSMVTAVYDPSAVLDPSRGISRLLTTVTSPTSEATESVNGKEAYRIKVTIAKTEAAALIPGITQDLQGVVWVAKDDKRLLKVKADIPPAAGSSDKGSVTVNFTDFNSDFKITAPQ